MLGRKLSVIKTSKKEAIWVKGEVKDFDEPAVRHKVGLSPPSQWPSILAASHLAYVLQRLADLS